ncbi:MAG: YkgJ family cysteine cluster protein [Leptonema sp. (in: bacteria)]
MKFKIFLYNFFYLLKKPKNGIHIFTLKKNLEKQNFYFQCTQCGKCCYGPGKVYFTKNDLIAIQQFLKLNHQKWKSLLEKLNLQKKDQLFVYYTNDKCLFLGKNNICKIYPVRPLQCLSFPFWSSNFSSKKSLQNLIQNCPGSYLSPKKSKNFYHSIFKIVFDCNQTSEKLNRYQKSSKGELLKL